MPGQDEDERVAEAWRALGQLERPVGMGPMTWLGVWAVLHRLCRYARYDQIFPAQEHLAGELDVPRTTLRRLLDHAEDAGLIKREPLDRDSWHGHFDRTLYHLTFATFSKSGISPNPARHHGTLTATVHGTLTATVHGTPTAKDRGTPTATNTLPSGDNNTVPSFGGNNDNSRAAAAAASPPPNQRPGPCVVCTEWVGIEEGTTQPGPSGFMEPVCWPHWGDAAGSVKALTPEEVTSQEMLAQANAFRQQQEAKGLVYRGMDQGWVPAHESA